MQIAPALQDEQRRARRVTREPSPPASPPGEPALLLTDDELEQLTGYKRTADQCTWLKRNGVPFYRQRLIGRPRVVREALTGPRKRRAEQEGPDLDWLKPNKGT